MTDFNHEACFDQLPRHQREVLEYIIEPDEPLTHATLMIGGMNPNNVKLKYREGQIRREWERRAERFEHLNMEEQNDAATTEGNGAAPISQAACKTARP